MTILIFKMPSASRDLDLIRIFALGAFECLLGGFHPARRIGRHEKDVLDLCPRYYDEILQVL